MKISVVTIGLIIGVIFLFVQLKLYFSIFMKWRQSNRIIIIRNLETRNTVVEMAQPSLVSDPASQMSATVQQVNNRPQTTESTNANRSQTNDVDNLEKIV